MPKLSKAEAEATKSADSGWDMEPGWYEVELSAVRDTDPKTKEPYSGPAGPYWVWEVTFPDDANEGRYKRRKLFRVISNSESTAGMRKEAFAAFGGSPDDDTDTMIGRRGLVKVGNRTYNGQERPEIQNFAPLAGAESGTGKAAAEDDDAGY